MSLQGTTQAVFAGPAPLAALLRSRDWSQTSLGDVTTWPPALKTTLGIVLSAKTPMACVWGCDRVLLHNLACATLLPAVNTQGQPLTAIDGWGTAVSATEQVFATGRSQSFDFIQDAVLYHWACSPIWDEAGQVGGVFITGQATHCPSTEGALRKSEEQLRLAQQGAEAGLWDWDMVANDVTWSEEYYHLYGLPLTVKPSYDNWLACISPLDRPHVEQKVREAIERGKNLKTSFRIAHPQDGRRWIMVRGQTFYDAAGNPIRMTGIAINVTEQKRFEQALIGSEAIARTQAEELAALMETAPAAIWIAHDVECRQMTANRMAHQLMQAEPGSLPAGTSWAGGGKLPFK